MQAGNLEPWARYRRAQKGNSGSLNLIIPFGPQEDRGKRWSVKEKGFLKVS